MFVVRWKKQIGGLTSLAYGLMWLASLLLHDHTTCATGCCPAQAGATEVAAHEHQEHADHHHGHNHSHGACGHHHRHSDPSVETASAGAPQWHAANTACDSCALCEWWQHLLTTGLPVRPTVAINPVRELQSPAEPQRPLACSVLPACRGPPAA